ncbi:MAG: glutamate synthase [bacterium]
MKTMHDIYRNARKEFRRQGPWFPKSDEAEGGCGVTGFACTIPVSGKNIYEPSIQMRNRGNGKGGGIAVCGLVPEDMGVSRKVLDEDYILQIALLDPACKTDVEKTCIEPYFTIDQGGIIPTVDDYREVPLLEVKPPDIARYFVRVKPDLLQDFASRQGLTALSSREVEDEFVFQNSIRLNNNYYSSLGDKRAFVMSHARNLIILKIVGYAEAVVQYYRMANTRAHVWIAHQRYPTKGRVWHPGGAHPFIGMNEALVHNGDFANYHSVSEFLAQRNLFPLFLTDTEVSVLLFDLMNRVYKYPIEYIIEALAPTTELDFDRLSEARQKIYREIQVLHTGASPDGPWFFIIARNLTDENSFQLVGITDTAMLRPQVFALQEGDVSVGLICTEKQAIDATLASLAQEDPRITPVADMYWNARGGSYTDGGAFLMTVSPKENGSDHAGTNGSYTMRVTNKFGDVVTTPPGQKHYDLTLTLTSPAQEEWSEDEKKLDQAIKDNRPKEIFSHIRDALIMTDYNRIRWFADECASKACHTSPAFGIEALTLCMDLRYPTGAMKRSSLQVIFRNALEKIFESQPLFDNTISSAYRRITWDTRALLRAPQGIEQTLLINARGFTPEGAECDARYAVSAHKLGWKHIIHYNSRGTRFHAAGFGPCTDGLRVDCYDNPGDYLGSGMDGLAAYIHGNAQDQLCQIAKRGTLVVYGDVGQTFLYGAKGGSFYVMGNAAGRPMINAVGKPRVVINGTALDFLAESFMAGIPLKGGGFAIINGLRFDENEKVVPLELPYPGSNLLSLASGGAIYVRDPHATLVNEQLNGGAFTCFTPADWKLILPYLQENERLFGIEIERDLLTVNGVVREPAKIYRKVVPSKDAEIEEELEGIGD